MKFFSTLFSKIGILLLAYFVVGVLVGPPGAAAGHFPGTAATGTSIHAWLQWALWVIFWPIGVVFHHPTFSL